MSGYSKELIEHFRNITKRIKIVLMKNELIVKPVTTESLREDYVRIGKGAIGLPFVV